jgi:two-component system sensor histidine kinase/response regulator
LLPFSRFLALIETSFSNMANVDTLRVLLIENNPGESQRISLLLEGAHHAVLPLHDLKEAAEALEIQKFDAVLVPSDAPDKELKPFTAKLRQLEQNQRSAVRTPILSVSPEVPIDAGWLETHETSIDGYLPERFEPAVFAKAVESLAGSLLRASSSTPQSSAEPQTLPRFDPDGFQEQMAYDHELAVEIINLFLGECVDQVAEMRQALASGNLPSLSRIAHTIKGSLGSLHAPRSRFYAQELELAAKNGEGRVCGPFLDKLIQELEALRPELIHLRGV